LVCVASALGLSKFLLSISPAYETEAWSKTRGTVISSKVVRGCGKGSSYYPQVVYHYSVSGAEYTGRRIGYGGACGSQSSAGSIASQFPEAATLDVYFNAQQPEESSLTIGEGMPDTGLGVALLTAMTLGSLAISLGFVSQARATLTQKQHDAV
jgi:hypothetical protein